MQGSVQEQLFGYAVFQGAVVQVRQQVPARFAQYGLDFIGKAVMVGPGGQTCTIIPEIPAGFV